MEAEPAEEHVACIGMQHQKSRRAGTPLLGAAGVVHETLID